MVLEDLFFGNEYSRIKIDSSNVVYDVSASTSIGVFTLLSSKKTKRVMSIEPEKGNIEILRLNMSRNNLNNTILVNKAVGDSKRKFNMSSNGGSARVVPGIMLRW